MSNLLKPIQKAAKNLTKINSSSPKFYLLLLPPVYIFWSIAIINIVFKKGKNLMTVFALVMSVVALLLIVIYGYGLWFQLPFIKTITFKMIYYNYLIMWMSFCLIVSSRSLKYEKEKGISTPNFADYFVRFFVLTNWYIGVWSFQSVLQAYKNDSKD